jgi:hypothetical protein
MDAPPACRCRHVDALGQLLVGVSRVALQFSQYKGYTSLLDRERAGFTMSAILCDAATSADVTDTSS